MLIGSGGREHAIASAIRKSRSCTGLWICPGNPGMAEVGININIQISDFEGIKNFIQQKKIDLVVVGSEQPLSLGITDFLQSFCAVCGPNQSASRLESSKSFAKQFFIDNNIPTARYQVFKIEEASAVLGYADELGYPCVLKASGLAAGKGVVICHDKHELSQSLHEFLTNKSLQQAAREIIVEEFLLGKEVSCFVLTDGREFIWLPEAKDYKRAQNGDTGPNTGGMGSVSPVTWFDNSLKERILRQIVEPTLFGLQKQSIEYRGFLFLGIMVVDNQPFMLEYNVRLGDPETQVILPRIEDDFVQLCYQAATKTIQPNTKLRISPETILNVVCASAGYPGEITTGHEIEIKPTKATIYHAGTIVDEKKRLLTAGGRVLNVTVAAKTLELAIANAYLAIQDINFTGIAYRTDIGLDLLPNVS